jgi:hypothetical protein
MAGNQVAEQINSAGYAAPGFKLRVTDILSFGKNQQAVVNHLDLPGQVFKITVFSFTVALPGNIDNN